MDPEPKTCGSCHHKAPCNKFLKGAGWSRMAESGWLSCSIRQSSAQDQAKVLSPGHPACSLFKPQ